MARVSFLNGVPAHRRRFLTDKFHVEVIEAVQRDALDSIGSLLHIVTDTSFSS
jgi:hypothetical protein